MSTIKKRPAANRMTFALLTLMLLGFGILAEHHAESDPTQTLHAQTNLSGH